MRESVTAPSRSRTTLLRFGSVVNRYRHPRVACTTARSPASPGHPRLTLGTDSGARRSEHAIRATSAVGSIRKSPRNPTRWEARYRDVSGNQRTRTFQSRADAKAWLAATETDIRRGSWIDPTMAATKVDVLADHWLKATHTKRAGSIARDQNILNTHILPVLGNRGVGSVTRAEVQQLVNDWVAHAAASTVVRQYACLRALFSYAEECELIPRSPCRNIRVPEAHPRDSLILDDAQIAKLGDALGRYRPMLYLALLGLRWGEIAGLRVGDVDFLRGSLTVTRQRTRGEKGRMVEHDPKTRAGRRSLSLPAWMTEMLANHLVQRALTGDAADALLFASPRGEPFHYSNWRRNRWIPRSRRRRPR